LCAGRHRAGRKSPEELRRSSRPQSLPQKPKMKAQPPKIRSAVKPFILPPVKPKTLPPMKLPQEAKPKIAPEKPPTNLAPATVSVYLRIASELGKEALGAVFLLDTRCRRDIPGGARAIMVKVFRDRPLISQALERNDPLPIRFTACLLLSEFLFHSKASRGVEIHAIADSVKKLLGAPWEHSVNLTFLTAKLAGHDMTALDVEVPREVSKDNPPRNEPWLDIAAELPNPSTLWQWNKEIPRPEKNPTPEKEPNNVQVNNQNP
jgi:hypothetical protein